MDHQPTPKGLTRLQVEASARVSRRGYQLFVNLPLFRELEERHRQLVALVWVGKKRTWVHVICAPSLPYIVP